MKTFSQPHTEDLSFSQQNIWNLEQALPHTPINHISTTLFIDEGFDAEALQRTLNAIVEHDETLRTRLTLIEGRPRQYFVPFVSQSFPVLDFSAVSEAEFAVWQKAMTQTPMPYLDQPLIHFYGFQTGETCGGVLILAHHLISDGWAQVLLHNRIAALYCRACRGESLKEAELTPYREHLRQEQAYLRSPRYERDQQFWQRETAAWEAPKPLRTAPVYPPSPISKRFSRPLSESLSRRLQAFCSERQISPFIMILLGLTVYLSRVHAQKAPVIGVPVINRSQSKEKNAGGMFVSTLPFRCETDPAQTADQFCQTLNDQWYRLLKHQKYPFTEIMKLARAQQPELEALFSIALSYEDTRLTPPSDTTVHFSGAWHFSGWQMEELCLHVSHRETAALQIDYDYQVQSFSEARIAQLHQSLTVILQDVLTHPDTPLSQLRVLEEAGEDRVLYAFNPQAAAVCSSTLTARWRQIAENQGQTIAIVDQDRNLTFAQLNAQAEALAAQILTLPQEKPLRIALLLPRGEALITGMLAAMLSHAVWINLDPVQPANRLKTLLAQTGADLIISSCALREQLDPQRRWAWKTIEDDQFHPAALADAPRPFTPPETAYIVTTSGTTGTPKGVLVGSASLCNFIDAMAGVYPQNPVLSLCSPAFDAFLIESICALLNGRSVVFADAEAAENPAQLADYIGRHHIGMLSLTPSRLQAYLRHPAFCQAVSRLDCLVCGGEAYPSVLLRQLKRWTSARLYNQYGPSEATIGVCMKELSHARRITAGQPLPGCRLLVLDPTGQPLPCESIGELWISGPCLALGYDQDRAKTDESFQPLTCLQGERAYRTGDLAYWTQDGEIVIAGRQDQQLKVRGYRIEAQEITAQLRRLPHIQNAAVVLQNDRRTLAAYIVSDQPVDPAGLRRALMEQLPAPVVPSVYLAVDELPLTANGKLDPSRLPPLPQSPQPLRSAATSAAQRWLLDQLRTLLKRPDMQLDSDYFAYGGDSLIAMELLSLIEEKFQIRLKTADLYHLRTAAAIGEVLDGGQSAPQPKPQAAPKQKTYPLSFQQKAILADLLADPENDAYHMPGLFTLPDTLDIDRLRQALVQLVQEEELLRTGFVLDDGEIRMQVHDKVAFNVEIIEAGPDWDPATLIRPMDLARPPLFSAAFIHRKEGWALGLDMHHLISDGLTTPLLLSHLDQLYQGRVCSSPALTYKDAAWAMQDGPAEADLAYWKKTLTPLPKPLLLPQDRREQPHQGGSQLIYDLSLEGSEKIRTFCAAKQLTPAALFACAALIQLARWNQSDRVVVGMPVSGRTQAATQAMPGLFMHTLPLALQLDPQMRISALLARVQNQLAAIQDHQAVSLEDLIRMFNLPRQVGGNAVFGLLFSLRPIAADQLRLAGQPLGCQPVATGLSKLPLTEEVYWEAGRWHFCFEFENQRYREETIRFYQRSLEHIVMTLTKEDPVWTVLDVLAPLDRYRCLDAPNALRVPYCGLPLDVQIRQRARLHPDQPALRFHQKTTTFAELIEQADRLAGALMQNASAKPAGILCERGEGLFVAMLALMHCGRAYVPLDPDFPSARIATMLDQAGADLIVGTPALLKKLNLSLPTCSVLAQGSVPFEAPARPLDAVHYCLFTSGSTGLPKGTQITYRNTAAFLESMRPLIGGCRRALCATNSVFDVFLTESLIALALDMTVVIADESQLRLPWELAALIQNEGCDFVQFTPTRMQMNMADAAFREALASVKTIIHVGEALPAPLVRQTASCTSARILNCYGPTETTVYATWDEVSKTPVTIGMPLANYETYVLNKARQRCLPMQSGELVIGGAGVGLGYINAPTKNTAFVQAPQQPQRRFYFTGDLVRVNPQGKLEYLGRRDSQIKLNGHRIELQEIEQQLLRLAGIRECAVIPRIQDHEVLSLHAFVSGSEETDWRPALQSMLPDFMIPSSLTWLDHLPLTASGKTDRRALAALIETAAADRPCTFEGIQPEIEMPPVVEEAGPADLAAMWRKVLKRSELDENLSFFDQGGTSLGALTLLTEYYNLGLHLTLEEFYAHPTLAEQRQKIQPEWQVQKPVSPRLDKFPLQSDAPVNWRSPLISGGSGFFGLHLIDVLLTQNLSCSIVVLSRSDKATLLEKAQALFGPEWVGRYQNKLVCLHGDLTRSDLGLSAAERSRLQASLTCVVHSAAEVSHYGRRDAFLAANVESTRNMLALARQINVPLVHVSTLSVSGSYLPADPQKPASFCETDLDIGQNWNENLYVESKFLAEQAVRQAIAAGQPARILRLGRLCGRHRDGQFQRHPQTNAFWRLCQAILQVGCLNPALAQTAAEVTAVDECALAAVAGLRSRLTVLHLMNPHLLSFKEIFPQLPIVGDEQFAAALQREAGSGSDVIGSLIEQLNQLEKQPVQIQPDAAVTLQALEAEGYRWPLPRPDRELAQLCQKRGESR